MENYSISVHQKDNVKTRIGTLKNINLPNILETCRKYAKRKDLVFRFSHNKEFYYLEFINRYQNRHEPIKGNIVDICIKVQ